MLPNIHSVVLVTSIEMLEKNYEALVTFFHSMDVVKKDMVIFSQKPILDYSKIKKIPTAEMIIIYQKDFFTLNIMIKSVIHNILKQKNYSILIHFNDGNFLRNTYLISKSIPASIKITNTLKYSKSFSVVIQDQTKFFVTLLDYLNKVVI